MCHIKTVCYIICYVTVLQHTRTQHQLNLVEHGWNYAGIVIVKTYYHKSDSEAAYINTYWTWEQSQAEAVPSICASCCLSKIFVFFLVKYPEGPTDQPLTKCKFSLASCRASVTKKGCRTPSLLSTAFCMLENKSALVLWSSIACEFLLYGIHIWDCYDDECYLLLRCYHYGPCTTHAQQIPSLCLCTYACLLIVWSRIIPCWCWCKQILWEYEGMLAHSSSTACKQFQIRLS